ncbi:aminopeptidase N-like [Topomyia yanbarensis]|uniref:aminopeptidase N-like n=1 Tax=Topomyia yanbarensis TaxID=2498891 RepID=UPI00273BEFDE|nr:aminopeptidase N-like [Topomyia yanbarensis]
MNRFCGLVLMCLVLTYLVADIGAQNERHYRLPNNTSPIEYDLTLTVDLKRSIFFGTVNISLVALSATKFVALNVQELDISKTTLTDPNGQNITIDKSVMQNDSEIVRFELSSYLEIGHYYQMVIEFAGNITGDLKGLYKSSYYRETEERFVATTFNAAAYARKIFPCYDEPHLKATFKLRIYHASEFQALSNMLIETIEPANSDNMSLTTFVTSPLMSSYLFAFVVSDFSALRIDQTFAVHAQSSVLNSTRYALDFTKDAISQLAGYFKRPYQLSKLDIVAVDDFLMGAMENWGLITYKTSRIVYRSEQDKTEKLQSVTKIVFHELIHQWFGNEVTCAWWSYVWLNEGFTVFLETYILHQMYPDWRLMDQFLVNEMHPVMARDVLPATRAMTKSVNSPDQIAGIYDFVVYPKAASVIRMFHAVVGSAVFDEFVVQYLDDRSYKAATEDDMIRILQSVVTEHRLQLPPMNEFVKSWTNNPSYPLVTVIRDQTNSALVSAIPVNTFCIPIPWISKHGKHGYEWLQTSDSNKSIVLSGTTSSEWILFNPNQNGYYRVNYDRTNWNMLVDALSDNHESIPVLNRAQLIDDALYFARNNLLDIEILLGLLSYLPSETDLIPLKAGFKAFKHLNRVFRGNDLYESYLVFQTKLLGQVYDRLLMNDKNDHISKLYRAEVRKVACEMGVPKCLQDAVTMFDGFELIEPDLRAAVICGSMKGSESYNIWAMVVRRMVYIVRNFGQKRINVEEFEDILYGFGCAVSRERLDNFMLLSLSNTETLEQQDRIKMFNYIACSGVNGTDEALNRLINDFNTLKRRYGSLTEVVSNLRYSISTQKQLQLFSTFMHNHTDSDLFNLQNKVYEVARSNIRWAAEKLPSISKWIANSNSAGKASITKTFMTILLAIGSYMLCK